MNVINLLYSFYYTPVMENPKPLSYLSLKCVLSYMNVNFRIANASQLPSLRNIQMTTPLRLKTLTLNKYDVGFDDLHYFFSVFLEKNEEKWKSDYSIVRVYHDVNPDGSEDTNPALMTGDIIIHQRQERQMDRQQLDRPELPLNLESYVQCDIQYSSDILTTSIRSQNGIKMRDIMRKQINSVLGGNRIHQVNHLDIRLSHGILRLPEGLKLNIRELTISDNGTEVLEAIRPILNASSFPLKSLSVKVQGSSDPVFQNEILRTSESLNIYNSESGRWANFVINLPNKKIHFYYHSVIPNEVCVIAKNWIKNSRSIGSKFSMQSISVGDHLNEVKSELQAVEGHISEKILFEYPSCYSLPMNSTSELNFYGCKSPSYAGPELMFVMEVMPIGTFIPNDK